MYYLGVDVGGTNIAVGIVDENNAIIAKASHPTPVPCSEDAFCDAILAVCNDALAKAGLTLDDVPWIGIGCPGTVNRATGIIEFANNLYFKNFKLRDMMAERTNGKLVILENDANAAAYGEYQAGALAGADNALAITLGTGVGGGVVLDGKMLTGYTGAASELGHMVIRAGGEECTCGRRGCFEAYASATALIRETKRAMAAHPESRMHAAAEENGAVDGRTAFIAAQRGDAAAQAVVDRYLDDLACGVANIVNIFFPEVIALSGGVANQGDTLLVPLRERVRALSYGSRYAVRHTRIELCTLGYRAGVIGAALLAKQS